MHSFGIDWNRPQHASLRYTNRQSYFLQQQNRVLQLQPPQLPLSSSNNVSARPNINPPDPGLVYGVQHVQTPTFDVRGANRIPTGVIEQDEQFFHEITKKPLRVTLRDDGRYEFHYAPEGEPRNNITWPKRWAYEIMPELFEFNPRAYVFVPGKTSHKLIIDREGEGGGDVRSPLIDRMSVERKDWPEVFGTPDNTLRQHFA